MWFNRFLKPRAMRIQYFRAMKSPLRSRGDANIIAPAALRLSKSFEGTTPSAPMVISVGLTPAARLAPSDTASATRCVCPWPE